jgi:hypothetical protein
MSIIGARIYLKPLLPEDIRGLDLEKLMQAAKKSLLRRLRGKLLQQTVFTPEAKAALAKSIQVKVMPSSLQVITNHPGFLPMVKGQKRQQMTWLTKARAPIPIILDSGELIFRSATPASMERGSWWHPGRTPSNYVDKAKAMTRKFMRERMLKEITRNMSLQMTHTTAKGLKNMKTK